MKKILITMAIGLASVTSFAKEYCQILTTLTMSGKSYKYEVYYGSGDSRNEKGETQKIVDLINKQTKLGWSFISFNSLPAATDNLLLFVKE